MSKEKLMRFVLLFALFSGIYVFGNDCRGQVAAELREVQSSQSDQIERCLWYNEEKTAKIQVYKANNGRFYGKIVWLKVPDVDGKPKMDSKNPDRSRQNEPIMGLVILNGLKKTGDFTYEDGEIYDPKNGKTYSCKMTYKGNVVDIRGYIGISLFGRSTTWTRSE